jgi:HAD superfamily hydrolase (TIGR01509 family)
MNKESFLNNTNEKPLIIFDMDGLMFDTETLAIKLWGKIGKEFGYEIKPELVFETIGIGCNETEKIFIGYFGEDFPFWKIRTLREEYAFKHVKENGIPVKKGLYELLDFLEDNKISKALATSSERVKAEKYLTLGKVIDRFDCTVCGDEVKNGKPDPEIFQKVARKAGFNIEDCIVLEDSESGILSASGAGMKPIFIKDIKDLSEGTKKLIFKEFQSLLEVRDYFESIL